jgi:hypothetical protein
VFAAVDGRFGEVIVEVSTAVALIWLDDGTRADNVEKDTLTSVVASRTDLIEEYSHIRALGEALSEAKVKQVSLVRTKFSNAALIEFVQSVLWATAALTKLDVRRNKALDEAALAELRAAAPKTCKILTD